MFININVSKWFALIHEVDAFMNYKYTRKKKNKKDKTFIFKPIRKNHFPFMPNNMTNQTYIFVIAINQNYHQI